MARKSRKQRLFFWGAFIALTAGVTSWAIYNFINTGLSDLLLMAGITNEYMQTGAIIVIGVLTLSVLAKRKLKDLL